MHDEPWRLLVVAGDEGSAPIMESVREMLGEGLRGTPPRIDVERDVGRLSARIAGAADGSAVPCAQRAVDAVIIAQGLPAACDTVIRAVRAADGSVPVLVVTCHNEDRLEMASLAAGASDVGHVAELTPVRLVRRLGVLIRAARAEIAAIAAYERAEAAEHAREEVLAIVSHDLRGPLSAIGIAAESLVDEDSRGERAHIAGAVRRGIDRAEKLIRDVLEASRIESGCLELSVRSVECKTLIHQAARHRDQAARDAGMAIQPVIDDACGAVAADRDRVAQVLDNLINNAIRHARSGGVVEVSAAPDGDRVAFSVADRGPGIAPDHLPHIFDRLSERPRHRRGSGLGLAIARGILEAHGATLQVTSAPGAGARFTFALPRAR